MVSIFGKGSYLNPNDTRQYLYKLKPKSPLEKNMKVCLITEEKKTLNGLWTTCSLTACIYRIGYVKHREELFS